MATTKRARRAQQDEQPRDPRVMSDDEVPEDLEEPISYEDALRYLRRQKLVCKGPLPQEHADHAAKLFRQGKVEMAFKVRQLNRGVRNPSTGDLDPCGYDLTDMIEATQHPLDGSEMVYVCPKCGNEGTMRPARFNVLDQPDAAKHRRLHEQFIAQARANQSERLKRAARIAKARG